MGAAPRLFRSSGQGGHLPEILQSEGLVHARKLEREVQVRFVDEACTIQTREGAVHAQPGDAVITGMAGKRWRVSRRHFADKYRPAGVQRPGEPGTYVSLPNAIVAVRMQEAFEVLLADGVSRLHGCSGDWLVDYGDGSLGVVQDAIFRVTYRIEG